RDLTEVSCPPRPNRATDLCRRLPGRDLGDSPDLAGIKSTSALCRRNRWDLQLTQRSPRSAMVLNVRFNSLLIRRALACTVALLLLFDLTSKAVGRLYPGGHDALRMFKVDNESSFANWFKSAELAACAFVLMLIARQKQCTGDPRRKHWTGLAWI